MESGVWGIVGSSEVYGGCCSRSGAGLVGWIRVFGRGCRELGIDLRRFGSRVVGFVWICMWGSRDFFVGCEGKKNLG